MDGCVLWVDCVCLMALKGQMEGCGLGCAMPGCLGRVVGSGTGWAHLRACWGCFGGMAEAGVGQGPGTYALVGWLECPDPAPIFLWRWRGNVKNGTHPGIFDPGEIPEVSHPFGRCSRICKWISFIYSLIALLVGKITVALATFIPRSLTSSEEN